MPPAAIALSGELSGVVFTAPASQWSRTDTVGHWPPTADAAGPFRAWEASLAAGTLVGVAGWQLCGSLVPAGCSSHPSVPVLRLLQVDLCGQRTVQLADASPADMLPLPLQVLRPIVPPPGAKPASPQGKEKGDKASKSSKEGGSRASASGCGGKEVSELPAQGGSPVAAAAASEASQQPPPAKVGIPLEGCTVELVADGLKGRSEFIRRAPLLVSHPKWPLLEGEQAFFLWAGAGCEDLQGRLACAGGMWSRGAVPCKARSPRGAITEPTRLDACTALVP